MMGQHAHARSDAPAAASDALVSELARIAAGSSDQITGENFPVALRVLPAPVREQLRRAGRGLPARVRSELRRSSAFARFVDDVGACAAGDRLELLDAVDRDV